MHTLEEGDRELVLGTLEEEFFRPFISRND